MRAGREGFGLYRRCDGFGGWAAAVGDEYLLGGGADGEGGELEFGNRG